MEKLPLKLDNFIITFSEYIGSYILVEVDSSRTGVIIRSYIFSLRTSETAYLNEAYSFYYAIRGRSYYTKASKEDKCELMVKKLRYYARFIVVCLLLKKLKLVTELIRELDKQIVEYGNAYDPEDQAEWTVVVNEVKAFIKAEPVVSVVHPDNYSVILSHR